VDECVFLYTTWPDAEMAQAFAAEAIAERLAACANILAPMTSIYRWEGSIQQSVETPMILKTIASMAQPLRDFLGERHPYANPCLVALKLEADLSAPDFLDWIRSEVSPATT
jgi:periplasmic divalent cation tolerance protein